MINPLMLHAGLTPVPPRHASAPVRRVSPPEYPARPLVAQATTAAQPAQVSARALAADDMEAVASALREAEYPLMRSEIANRLDMDPERVSNMLFRLRKMGRAKSTGPGNGCVWKLTEQDQ